MGDITFTVKDGRGSKDQRLIYDWLNLIYIKDEVIYEQYIPDLNLRIDLYIPSQKLAIEYHGKQHYQYTPHFHKDYSAFELSKIYDDRKLNYLLEHGITVIEIPYNHTLKSKEDLVQYIEAVDVSPYPFKNFIKEVTKPIKDLSNVKTIRRENKEKYKASESYKDNQIKLKEKAKAIAQTRKEKYYNSEEYKQKQLELKELRKKKYQQFKKNK